MIQSVSCLSVRGRNWMNFCSNTTTNPRASPRIRRDLMEAESLMRPVIGCSEGWTWGGHFVACGAEAGRQSFPFL